MGALKMTDMKMTDHKIARHEIAGHEIAESIRKLKKVTLLSRTLTLWQYHAA